MADDRYEQYEEVVRRVLGARADQAISSPAWSALGATLSRVERAGYDTFGVLGRAYNDGAGVRNARDVSALLTWTINREIPRPDPAAPPTAPEESRTAAVPPARAAAPAPPAADGIPAWQDRPFGTMADAALQAGIAEVRAEATRAAVVARESRDSATTALEVARSQRGPAATALDERHGQLTERVQAMDALARLDREYREVRDAGGFGDQAADVLRARLAVAEARYNERTMFGLLNAVRGEARAELADRIAQLSNYIEDTGPRLAELDSRRAPLERAAGPANTRGAAYSEWQVMDRQLGQLRTAARDSDVADAYQRHREADRLTSWAQDRGERHDQMVTEAATRTSLPPERVSTERHQRAEAAMAGVTAAAAAIADTTEAEQAYQADVTEEASQSRSL